MSYNISYVSSALSTSNVSGTQEHIDDIKALGATKYGDIFIETSMADLNLPTCGKTCYVKCSCNEANGWYATPPSGDYVSATSTRKYAANTFSSGIGLNSTTTANTFAADLNVNTSFIGGGVIPGGEHVLNTSFAQTCYKESESCHYDYYQLTEEDTGTEFFKYVNSATGGADTWYQKACTETSSCVNGVNASGGAETYYNLIYNKISSSSATCVNKNGVTKYESICNGSRNSCGNKKTISTCESFNYMADIQGKDLPVLGATYYQCGTCDTSRRYYDTESACKASNSNKVCILDNGCYATKCSGYYDTLAECENGKSSDQNCETTANGCYDRVNNYFEVKLSSCGIKTYNGHDALRIYLVKDGTTIHPTTGDYRSYIKAQATSDQEVEMCLAAENECIQGTGNASSPCKYVSTTYWKLSESDKVYEGGTQNGSAASPWWVCQSGSTDSLCTYETYLGGCTGSRCDCFKIKARRGITYTITPVCTTSS